MRVKSEDKPLVSTCPQLADINDNFPLEYSLKFAYLCVFIYIHGLPRWLSESEVTQSCPTLSDPMDYSPPGPPSMGFSRQEYWSRVPLPSPLTAARHIIFTWSWYAW